MGSTDNFSSIEELAGIVDENQGVVTVSMQALRNAYGAERLGVHVRAGLSRALKQAGLGHLPRELPDSQNSWARIYRRGSAVNELIDAVHSIDHDSDQLLRERAANDAADTIQKIREMICG